MIEFGLKHKHSSSWHKKFPRQKIEREDPKHLGMHEHLRLRNEWFEGRCGYLSWKDLDKFFEKHLGENVDKVFSEFIKRAKRFDHDVNLKDRFFDELRSDKRWRNNYTLDSQRRIVKVKKGKDGGITYKEALNYNKIHFPTSFKPYMKKNELTYIGHFYLREKGWNGCLILAPIFITNKDWYDTVMQIGFGKEYVKYSNMSKITINLPKYNNWAYSDRAVGVPNRGYDIIYEKTGHSVELANGYLWDIERPVQIPYTFRPDNADYIFLTKGLNWDSY